MFYYSFYQNHPEKEGYQSLEEGITKDINQMSISDQEILEILQYKYQN